MPTVALQNQKVATLRKKLLTLYKGYGQAMSQAEVQASAAMIDAMAKPQVIAAIQTLSAAKMQSQSQSQSQRTSAKAQSQSQSQRTSAKSKKARTQKQKIAAQKQASKKRLDKIRADAKLARTTKKTQKPGKSLRTRANKITRAIKGNTLAVRQQKRKYTDFTNLKTGVEKYTAFTKLYSDVRFTSKKRRSKKSVKEVFVQIQGQKLPYMLKKSKRIPARVAAVPGQGATPFNQLSLVEQQRVVSFLNSDKAKKLREKGAPRQVKFQDVKRQSKKTQSKTQAQTKPQGGSNYYR
jgi:hypothetical protein